MSASASASVASGKMVIGSTTIPLSNRLTLRTSSRLVRRLKIAVDDANAARFRHGDGEPRLGHGVHCGRDDRQIQANRAGELGSDIRRAWHDRAEARTQQHVVERQSFGNRIGFNRRHRHAPMWIEWADGARLASAAWRGCLTWVERSS